MYCPNCGKEIAEKARYCTSCGRPRKVQAGKAITVAACLLSSVLVAVMILLSFQFDQFSNQEAPAKVIKEEKVEQLEQVKVEPQNEVLPKKQPISETPKDVSGIINDSQPKVFTIFTDSGQGSGFLINTKGDILTNAHVVEGDFYPAVKTIDGNEYQGTLIGYSNTTDIAVIRVPALANMEPLPLEESLAAEIGDEVIALGSPQGFENTATLGNISGVDRSFVIDPFRYDGIYQTSAPIAPGSSGGPLLNRNTGKVIAINSARHNQEVNIGFSIPLYQVMKTIHQWAGSPMTEEEIHSLFYYQGVYYYQDYLGDSGYFEDGSYNEDYHEYYELPYEEGYWDYEETDETEDYYYEEDEDYEGEESYENEENEDYEGEDSYEYEENEDYEGEEPYEYENNEGYESEEPYGYEDEAVDESVESHEYEDNVIEESGE